MCAMNFIQTFNTKFKNNCISIRTKFSLLLLHSLQQSCFISHKVHIRHGKYDRNAPLKCIMMFKHYGRTAASWHNQSHSQYAECDGCRYVSGATRAQQVWRRIGKDSTGTYQEIEHQSVGVVAERPCGNPGRNAVRSVCTSPASWETLACWRNWNTSNVL